MTSFMQVDNKVALEVASHEALIRQTYLDSKKVPTWCVGMTNATGHRVERYIGKAGAIRILPIGYMRGVTLEKSVVIIDEAQNLTEVQAKAIVTRIGEGTTYIINGDLDQTDVGAGNGFQLLQRVVHRCELPVPIVEFSEEDCVRSAACKMWLSAFRTAGL